MSENPGKNPTGRAEPEGWPLKDVWEKYEDIAMHFNDLLIRLRTQALAAVAAISTLVTAPPCRPSRGRGVPRRAAGPEVSDHLCQQNIGDVPLGGQARLR